MSYYTVALSHQFFFPVYSMCKPTFLKIMEENKDTNKEEL